MYDREQPPAAVSPSLTDLLVSPPMSAAPLTGVMSSVALPAVSAAPSVTR